MDTVADFESWHVPLSKGQVTLKEGRDELRRFGGEPDDISLLCLGPVIPDRVFLQTCPREGGDRVWPEKAIIRNPGGCGRLWGGRIPDHKARIWEISDFPARLTS
ncbi:MAG: hypothetical protein MI741_04565 [Rhodospirillales bacterium]|nr:hypothetical protein [Rhodospirillales bacterium]